MAITPEESSPPAALTRPVKAEAGASRYQLLLMTAIKERHTNDFWREISGIPSPWLRATLLARSTETGYHLRTPLMAAAATGNMAIFSAVLNAVHGLCRGKLHMRDKTGEIMARQHEVADVYGMTLLMVAAGSGDAAVFMAAASQIQPSQLRTLIPRKDSRGMTFLMHAVNAGCGHVGTSLPANSSGLAAQPPSRSATTTSEAALDGSSIGGSGPSSMPQQQEQPVSTAEQGSVEDPVRVDRLEGVPAQADESSSANGDDTAFVDPCVPVIKSALQFAVKSLWMAEYRKLLATRDSWNRSIIEHSIASGRAQVFEAVYDAIRQQIHDDKMDSMLDVSGDSSGQRNSMQMALQSPGGQEVSQLVAEKAKNLKKDVALRTEDSTVTSKIQSFIPGNLVVIFQLLLPEFDEESDKPLILLLVLCAISPVWVWGAAVAFSRTAERENTTARRTFARYVLAVPAMFFWGVGTSKIGSQSFGWAETASAAALAVAAIVIPALDSFFSGSGARETVDALTIRMLDFSEWLQKKCPCCGRASIAHDNPETPLQSYDANEYRTHGGGSSFTEIVPPQTTAAIFSPARSAKSLEGAKVPIENPRSPARVSVTPPDNALEAVAQPKGRRAPEASEEVQASPLDETAPFPQKPTSPEASPPSVAHNTPPPGQRPLQQQDLNQPGIWDEKMLEASEDGSHMGGNATTTGSAGT